MRARKPASSDGVEQIRERVYPRFGQRTGRSCLGVQLQMGEYFLNHFGSFDAGNDLHGTLETKSAPDFPSHDGRKVVKADVTGCRLCPIFCHFGYDGERPQP